MFNYFYNKILEKTVVAFGTLFNNIHLQKVNDNGDVVSITKVPISYGPTQKFLARLTQVPDLNKPIQMSLPRMSFEIIGISYDPSRKLPPTQTFVTQDVNDGSTRKAYLPVPYNVNFELSIMTKLNEDMLEIIEQIIPYFQPNYTLTIDLVKEIGEKRDIPIVLDNITMTDNYEGDFKERRALIYTLKFTAKTYIFGPIESSSNTTKDIIKKVSIGLVSGDSTNTPRREVTYTALPRAIQNYTGTTTTTLAKDIIITDVLIEVIDSTNIPINSYIDIDNEEIYVSAKSGNILTVTRGADSTPITTHVTGSDVRLITTTDDALIQPGDDFGFSGSFN